MMGQRPYKRLKIACFLFCSLPSENTAQSLPSANQEECVHYEPDRANSLVSEVQPPMP